MSLVFNQEQFAALFPAASFDTDTDYITYEIADANYRIKPPVWSADQLALTVSIDHIRGVAIDDHADLTITFGPDASVQHVGCVWNDGSGSLEIPQSVIDAVDKAADIVINELKAAMVLVCVVGVVAAPFTDGLSLVVAAELEADLAEVIELSEDAKKAFDISCKLYNKLTQIIVQYSDNGGRLYTAAVLAHTFSRLTTCVSVA